MASIRYPGFLFALGSSTAHADEYREETYKDCQSGNLRTMIGHPYRSCSTERQGPFPAQIPVCCLDDAITCSCHQPGGRAVPQSVGQLASSNYGLICSDPHDGDASGVEDDTLPT